MTELKHECPECGKKYKFIHQAGDCCGDERIKHIGLKGRKEQSV